MVNARAPLIRGLPDRWHGPRLAVAGLALAVAMGLALPMEVLGATILRNPSVSPASGLSGITFTFRVTSKGSAPTAVRAAISGPVGPISVSLKAPAGGGNGVWSGSRRFTTAGIYTVTFIATPGGSLVPGGTFRVIPATPTPTPRPTPRPTPGATPPPPPPTAKPTARATHAASASPRASGRPSGSASPTAAGTPVVIGGAVAPTPTPQLAAGSGSRPDDDSGSLLLAIGLGLLVIVGVGGIALLAGRRSAEERPVMATAAAGDGMPAVARGPAAVAHADEVQTAPRSVSPDAAAFAARVNERQGEQARGDPGAGGTPPVRRAWESHPGIDDAPIGTVDQVLIDGIPRSWERGEDDRRGRRRPAQREDDFEED